MIIFLGVGWGMGGIRTWFCALVAAIQRCEWAATERSLINAIVVDSCLLLITGGGNSLITNKTNAEGTDEPANIFN